MHITYLYYLFILQYLYMTDDVDCIFPATISADERDHNGQLKNYDQISGMESANFFKLIQTESISLVRSCTVRYLIIIKN